MTSVTIQAVTALVRVTTSYRAIELHLPVVLIGVISAVFAILPIFLAVWVGRYMDRGNDAQAAWIGSGLLVLACAGFRLFASSVNKPISAALRRVFDPQNPKPSCRIASGVS